MKRNNFPRKAVWNFCQSSAWAKSSFERILSLLRPTISRPMIVIKTKTPTIMPIIPPKLMVEGSSPLNGGGVAELVAEPVLVDGMDEAVL